MNSTAEPPASPAAFVASRQHRRLPQAWFVLAIALLGFVAGCSRSPEALTAAPPVVVQTLVTSLKDNEPQVLWQAMPARYQADLRKLIESFCTHMDPAIYDRFFRVMTKGVRVLREKQDYLFKSPVALSTPLLESVMGPRWNENVALLDTIATSELASLASLRKLDPEKFLATTGHQVMEAMEKLRGQFQRTPGPNPWDHLSRTLQEAKITFEPSAEDRGWLRFHSATNKALKDLELVRVEGRWVPVEMASSWSNRIEQATLGMAKLSGPEFEKVKPVVSMVLGTLEGAMDSLLKASSQKEFDDTLKGLAAIGGMLQSWKPKPQ